MALASNLVGKLSAACQWAERYIAMFHEKRGTGTLEALDSGLFDPVRHLMFERGLNIPYQSLQEELAARMQQHERKAGEISETLQFIDSLPIRQAEALVWRYGNRKKGGQPLGAKVIAARMGICKDSAQELVDKAESKMQQRFAQAKNKTIAA